jgi:hypothetical protein
MSSFATTFKLHEKASTSSSPSICIILFEIWVSNFKTYNAMQFLDKELLICPKNFLKKLHAISYSFQRSDSVHEFEPNDEEIILDIILEFMKCKPHSTCH